MLPLWSKGSLVSIALNYREKAVDKPAVTQQQPHSVLDALIGETNGCVAYLNGHPFLASLDTGSQVTSISDHFYQKHLSDRLVDVVGAAGQEVPFLGYVELGVSFPRTETGTVKVFQPLVQDVRDNQ